MNKKRVFIVHGWDGSPQGCWIPWLKKELEGNGFWVEALFMPNPEQPEIKLWVDYLNNAVGKVDKNTYFVGHSIGCQTILRYVEQLSHEKQIGGIVCVAGFFRLPYLKTEEEKNVAEPWLETKINFDKILIHTNKIIAIFSDDDPDVDLVDSELFKKYLGAKIIIEHNMGHFSDDDGVKKLKSVLSNVLKMSVSLKD